MATDPQQQPIQGGIDPVTGQSVASSDGQPPTQPQGQQPPEQPPPPQPQQQVTVSASPEGAPVPVNVEASPASNPEYGGEAIRRIEQQPQVETGAERKEAKPQPQQQPVQPQQKAKTPPKPPGAKTPKLFGYKVPQQIAMNLRKVSDLKGKGDPGDARTWMYVFLDRLIRKQSRS
ncbi:MAG: hypothetical protein ACE5DX_03165 [Candidatus Dojkabacteria bacterium]